MSTRKAKQQEEVTIELMERKIVSVYVVGESPLLFNRLAEKAKRELLYPGSRKTKADREGVLKHNPMEEYRSSPNRMKDPKAPMVLALPATAFKGALRSVAVDTPKIAKTEMGRWTYIPGEYVGIYGVPEFSMAVVRCADMNKTPDIRTRAIMPRWAARFDVSYLSPNLTSSQVLNMMANAGEGIGVGDGRPENGKLDYGRFRLSNADDPEYKAIVKSGGRKAQLAALENPAYYDDESRELCEWFYEELERRNRATREKQQTATEAKGNGRKRSKRAETAVA